MTRQPLEVTGAFISAINARDLTALRSLMSDDHVFTGARGTRFFGAERMIDNWQLFFSAYPQYWIHVDASFAAGNRVAVFGNAGGKWRVDGQVLPGSWQVSAAWLAEIEAGKVRRWSIYCDTEWVSPPEVLMVPELAILEA